MEADLEVAGHGVARAAARGVGVPSSTPLFASGAEAAAHGMQDYDAPEERTTRVQHKLLKKGLAGLSPQ